jgi:hypothetical protein
VIILTRRVIGWTAGFHSRQWQVFFPFTTFRAAHTHRIPEALSAGLKGQGREADHSPPSTAEVRNFGALTPLPISFHDVVRD